MRKNWLYLLGCVALMFSSCRKETDLISKNTSNQVYFSSKIAGLPQTRAQGTQWSTNDEIGIFMFQNGVVLDETTIVNNGFNQPYTTNGNGNFSPQNPEASLEFPKGSKVSFVGYYPYQKNGTLTPSLDISNQEDQPKLDFMVARNLTGLTSGQGPVALTFDRQMTKVELKIKGTDLIGLKANFMAMPSIASFDLSLGKWTLGASSKDISAQVSKNRSDETIVEWTIFPETSDGASFIQKYWENKLKINSSELNNQDGSGLSPQNRVTTAAMTKIMQYAQSQSWFPEFYKSLPEYNNMKMKSGTIGGALGYTGIQNSSSGEKFTFTLLVNNYSGSTSAMRKRMFTLLDVLK